VRNELVLFFILEKFENNLDSIDKKILAALQADASDTIAEIAERANVSQTPCWKRIKRLEERGFIDKRVALLNAESLNVGLVGYIQIRTDKHSDHWLKKFTVGIQNIPEVLECHRMTGDIDYLLKVAVPDMAAYDLIYKKLIKIVAMSDVSGSFSMEKLKQTTELPLNYAGL